MPAQKSTKATTASTASTAAAASAKATPVKDAPKTTSKSAAKSAPAKAAPARASSAKGSTRVPKEDLNQAVGFVYGGSLLKSNHVVFFKCDNINVGDHVRTEMASHYGQLITGRYIKCADADTVYEKVLADTDNKENRPEAEFPNIVNCSVADAVKYIKTASGASTAHSFRLVEAEPKSRASAKSKGASKAASAPSGKGKKAVEAEAEDEEEAEIEEAKNAPKKGGKPPADAKGKKGKGSK